MDYSLLFISLSLRFDPFNVLSLPLPMDSCIHVEIMVLRLDGSVPVKYGLRMSIDDRYCALKEALSKLCGLAPNELLLVEVRLDCIMKPWELSHFSAVKASGGRGGQRRASPNIAHFLNVQLNRAIADVKGYTNFNCT